MKDITRDLIRFAMVVIIVGALIYYLNPVIRYEYVSSRNNGGYDTTLRIDRFTGEAYRLTVNGWMKFTH